MALIINEEKFMRRGQGGAKKPERESPIFAWGAMSNTDPSGNRAREIRELERTNFERYRQDAMDEIHERIKSINEGRQRTKGGDTYRKNQMEDEGDIHHCYPPRCRSGKYLVNPLPLDGRWRRAAQPPGEGEATNEIPHGQKEARGQRDAPKERQKRAPTGEATAEDTTLRKGKTRQKASVDDG